METVDVYDKCWQGYTYRSGRGRRDYHIHKSHNPVHAFVYKLNGFYFMSEPRPYCGNVTVVMAPEITIDR